MKKKIKLWFVAFVFTLLLAFAAYATNFGATGLCDNEEWVIERIDSADMVWMALDSFDNPHITYANNPGDRPPGLKYATSIGSQWTIQTVHSAQYTGYFPSIALDSANIPHIAFQDNTDGTLKYAVLNRGSWAIERVDSTGMWWAATSIAIDSSDSARIAYFGVGINGMKFATRQGSSWMTSPVDRGGAVLVLRLDDQDRAHIAYNGEQGGVKYAVSGPSGWAISTVSRCGGASLVLDSTQTPHIACINERFELVYAALSASGWNFHVLDNVGTTGGRTSIAVNQLDYPHIAYFDGANRALKYAHYDGSDWTVSIVDDDVDVGYHLTSLAIDSAGLPHIAYHDRTNRSVKYASLQCK